MTSPPPSGRRDEFRLIASCQLCRRPILDLLLIYSALRRKLGVYPIVLYSSPSSAGTVDGISAVQAALLIRRPR